MAVQEYHNKWALILGGSSGLGLATAQKLAQNGMHICIVHRTRRSALPPFEKAVQEMSSTGIQVLQYNIDATRDTERDTIINDLVNKVSLGQFKVLVHSIARGNLKPFYDTDNKTLTTTDFHITLDAMAISLYDWVSAFAKANLFTPQDARVIAFTSEGSSRAWKNYGAVAAAKAALEAVVRNMALEFAPLGIKANAIQAGVTDTESLRRIPGSETLIEHAITRNPYSRLTRPEDVANAVYVLCRDEAAWINGAIIPVYGGEHII